MLLGRIRSRVLRPSSHGTGNVFIATHPSSTCLRIPIWQSISFTPGALPSQLQKESMTSVNKVVRAAKLGGCSVAIPRSTNIILHRK